MSERSLHPLLQSYPFVKSVSRSASCLMVIGLLLLCVSTSSAWAQDEEYLITRLGNQQLEKKNVESITQDHTGFMWFGSGNGLLRFDGRTARIYNHTVGSSRSLPVSRIRSVLTDRDGRLWATTQGGGLSLYRPETDDFENFRPQADTVSRQNVNNFDFRSITQGFGNELWISSYGGDLFYRFDLTTKSFTAYPVALHPDRNYISTLTITVLQSGDIWVGTDSDGIVVFGTDGREKARHMYNPQDRSSISGDSVRKIAEAPDGRIWIGLFGGGLSWFDPTTGTFGRPTSLYNKEHHKFNNVYDLLFDDQQRLWVATDDGLLVLDSSGTTILHHFEHMPTNPRSLVNNRVRSLFTDKSGLLWVGNEHGGLHKISRRSTFNHIGADPGNHESLYASTVRTFVQVDDSTIWVGVQGGGIHVLNKPDYRLIRRYRHNPRDARSLASNDVTAFLKEPSGVIWVGTWGGGLNRFDPRTEQFLRFNYDEDDPASITDDRIQLLHIDSKGIFWVGTENGLNVFDPQTGRFERILHHPGDPDSFFGKSVQSLAFSEDAGNVYWIGTWLGLIRLDRNSNTVRRFTYDFDRPGSLSSDHILSIHDDGDGSLWLGTFSGGLVHFDKATETAEAFLDSDGAPTNVVFAIIPDEAGYLWLSTNNGLSRFDPESRFFRNFNEDDGIRATEYWWGAAMKSDTGKVYFGSTSGFTVVDPKGISDNTFIPPVVISDISVFNRQVVVPISGRLELSHRENYLTIEFAALDYLNPRRNSYAYMLEGLDKSWIYAGNRNLVSYSSLRGGQYTFRVKGTNSDGLWNDTGVSLSIYIRPPFWQESWFYTLLLVVVVSVIFLFIRFRTDKITRLNRSLETQVSERTRDLAGKQEELLRRNLDLQDYAERLENQKQEIVTQQDLLLANSQELKTTNDELIRINQEKNNLIGIVAHDLRSPLATVISALQVIRMNPAMPASEVAALHESMEQYIKGQLTMISKILDIEAVESGKITLHPEQILLRDMFGRLVVQFHTELNRKHVELRQSAPGADIYVTADRNYLLQVLDNLLSNAIKFSPIGGIVELGFLANSDKIQIYIRDQGAGLSVADQQKLFGKFQKLSARPTGGESSTGLGLSIVKRFTEAMDGRVWCESESGKGATFFVEFPRG